MKAKDTPTILIVIGISGDLAKRKLLPAIEKLAETKEQPSKFMVIGVSRRKLGAKDILKGLPDKYRFLTKHLEMCHMDLEKVDSYQILAEHIRKVEKKFGSSAQRLYYLSVPPQVAEPIIRYLGESGLAKAEQTKLLLEKPFGVDLASSEELIASTRKYFKEEQVYRIDHYLAKEMAQNILIFRGSNALFKQTWNKKFIDKIEVIACEKLGIEGRAVFYEQTGALRDFVQSHLLQLAALTLMKIPQTDDLSDVVPHRLQALKNLKPPVPNRIKKYVKRGQYSGYKKEVGNPHSQVETFVSLTLFSKDPDWDGVPIQLVTGKATNLRSTEIRLHYRPEGICKPNVLVLRIYPDEGIKFYMWSKRPGYDRTVEQVALDFTYQEYFHVLPEAHEQVLLDAIRSDHSLFASSEEVKASWRILAPIQHSWSMNSNDLIIYKPGSSPEMIAGNR